MEVATLYNPAALDIPEVREALSRWKMLESWTDQLKVQMSVGGAVIIVGTADDTQLDGAAIVTLPQAFTDVMPWVVHFHNDGPRALTHKLVEAVLAFIKQAGYTSYKAFNQSGKPDKVWLRVFKQAGKPHFIGSAYIFDMSEGITDGSNSSNRRRNRNRDEPVRRQQRKQKHAGNAADKRPVNAAKLKRADKHDAAVVQRPRTNRRRRAG